MRAVIRLGQGYLIPHALVAFAQMGADPAVEDAGYVLHVLADGGLEEFTERDLFQVVKGRFKTMDPFRRALTVLDEHGFIRARPEPGRPGPGRKPSPTFDVNPYCRPDHTHTPGWPSSDRPDDAEFGEWNPTLAQNAHNPQNAWRGDNECDSEHSEDCEEQEIMEWTAAL